MAQPGYSLAVLHSQNKPAQARTALASARTNRSIKRENRA